MKGKQIIFTLLLAGLFIAGSLGAVRAQAAEYAPVETSKLEGGFRFEAEYSGFQYEQTLYFLFEDRIYTYTNDLAAKGKAPQVFKSDVDWMIGSGDSFVYTDMKERLHFVDLKKNTDKVIRKKVSYLSDYDGKVIKCIVKNNWLYLDRTGTEVKAPEKNASDKEPAFTVKDDTIKAVSTFTFDGAAYAGVKYNDKTYSLYRYDGSEYRVVLSRLKAVFTRCLIIDGKAYFLSPGRKRSNIYLFENDRLVYLANIDISLLEWCDERAIYTDGNYLVLLGMSEYSDSYWVYRTDGTRVWKGSFDVENHTYRFGIKNDTLYYDYWNLDGELTEEEMEEWDELYGDEWREWYEFDDRYNIIDLTA